MSQKYFFYYYIDINKLLVLSMKIVTLFILIIFIACENSIDNMVSAQSALPDFSNQLFMHSNHFRFNLEKDGTLGTGYTGNYNGEKPFFAYREDSNKITFDRHDLSNLPYLEGGGLLISVPSRNYIAPNFRTRWGNDLQNSYIWARENGNSFYKNVKDTIEQTFNIYGDNNSASYEQFLELDSVSFFADYKKNIPMKNVHIAIRMVTSSLTSTQDSNYVIFDYEITNTGTDSLLGLYASFLTNFEINEALGHYNAELNLSYESFRYSNNHLGLMVLNRKLNGLNFNLRDPGYLKYTWGQDYKYYEIKYNYRKMLHPNYDISTLTTATPITLAPNETKLVSFALVGGISEQNLLVNAKRAQVVYNLAH